MMSLFTQPVPGPSLILIVLLISMYLQERNPVRTSHKMNFTVNSADTGTQKRRATCGWDVKVLRAGGGGTTHVFTCRAFLLTMKLGFAPFVPKPLYSLK